MKFIIPSLIFGCFLSIETEAQQTAYKHTYQYDASGRLTMFSKNDSLYTNYQYDKDGNRTQQTKIKGTPPNAIEGAKQSDINSISVYPNPSFGSVNIIFGELKGLFTISLFDSWGRLIYEKENYLVTSSNQSYNAINLSNYSTGIYFVRIKGEQLNIVKKLVFVSP